MFKTKDEILNFLLVNNIRNFKINDDLTVDFSSNTDFSNIYFKELPFKINSVKGSFVCSKNNLTTLYNFPDYIESYLCVSNNDITNLKYFPKFVGKSIKLQNNKLTSLENIPEEINGNFDCSHNNLKNLHHFPKTVLGNVFCCHNKITSIQEINNSKIKGRFNATHNNIVIIEDFKLKDASFFNNNIKKFFYNENIKNVRYLNLSKNSITTLENTNFLFIYFKNLLINSNELTTFDNFPIDLEHLEMTGNKFKNIYEFSSNCTYLYLDLGENYKEIIKIGKSNLEHKELMKITNDKNNLLNDPVNNNKKKSILKL